MLRLLRRRFLSGFARFQGLVYEPSDRREAERRRDEARRAVAEAAVERDAVDARLLRAHRAVVFGIDRMLRREYVLDAEGALGIGCVAVFLAQAPAHLGGERIVVGAGEVGDPDV